MKKKLKNKSLKILITYLFCASTYTYINVDAMKTMKNDGNKQQLSQIDKINLEDSNNKVNYTENNNILNNKNLKNSIIANFENRVNQLKRNFKNGIIEDLKNKIKYTQNCILKKNYDTAQNYIKQIYNILDKNEKCLEVNIKKDFENKVKELEKGIKDNVICVLNSIVKKIQEEAKLKDPYPRKKLIKEICNILDKNGKYLEENIRKDYENKIKELEKNFKNENIENLIG